MDWIVTGVTEWQKGLGSNRKFRSYPIRGTSSSPLPSSPFYFLLCSPVSLTRPRNKVLGGRYRNVSISCNQELNVVDTIHIRLVVINLGDSLH